MAEIEYFYAAYSAFAYLGSARFMEIADAAGLDGAWGGGWQYTKVQPLLEQAGHTVYRPTMTGLGERVHLGGPDVGLSTHIEDIVKVLDEINANADVA